MDTMNAICGSRIKALRTHRGWSQEQLAEVARVSTRTVQRLEVGETCGTHSLRSIAAALEVDVKELTATESQGGDAKREIEFIPRVQTGNELCDVVVGSFMFSRNNESLQNEKEVEVTGSFFQDLFDTSEIWDAMEIKDHIEAEYRFSQSLDELDELGFHVFASKTRRSYRFGIDASPMPMNVATVLVLRRSNPIIVKLASGKEAVAVAVATQDTAPGQSGREAAKSAGVGGRQEVQ